MSDGIPISKMQGGAPSFKFERLGDKVAGRIVSAEVRQQTDDDGRPEFWNDGKPKEVYVIGLDTGNGEVLSVWAKGGKYPDIVEGEGKSMAVAIGAAAHDAGAAAITIGDELAVAYTGVGKATGPAKNPPKLYTAAYKVAKASLPLEGMFSQ